MSFRLLPGSLVGRVFALYTVVLAGFVLAGLGLFYRYQFSVELEEAQLRAETLSAVVLPTIADSAVIGDYDTIRRTLERAVYHSSFSSASFIDLRGGLVRAPHAEAPPVDAPDWLVRAVAERLYDSNQPISVGGRDYGVLRLSFAPERIAGGLWAQTRIAIVLALASLAGGLLLIRFPLVRWLGNLSRVEQFEKAMDEGEAVPTLLAAEEAPTEFRATFEVLGRAAANLRSQRTQAAVTLGSIADGVFTLVQSGRIALANVAASEMLGRRAEDMLGRPAAEMLPQLFEAGGELVPWRNRRTTLIGALREVVVETTLSPILAPDGATVGHVLACRDVSEQHQLDQRLRTELRSREAALVELRKVLEGLTRDLPLRLAGPDDLAAISAMISELVSRLQVRGEQLDAIFALSPDGVVSFDAGRRANYVSPAFLRLTGLPAKRRHRGVARLRGDPHRGAAGAGRRRAQARPHRTRAPDQARARGGAARRHDAGDLSGAVAARRDARDAGRPDEERVPVHGRARAAHADGQHLRLRRAADAPQALAREAAGGAADHPPAERADGVHRQRAARPGAHRGAPRPRPGTADAGHGHAGARRHRRL
jgi:PAS domain S-box-containing protein